MTGSVLLETTLGFILAGSIRLGGPISRDLVICESDLNDTLSRGAIVTVSLVFSRVTTPVPLFSMISCWSLRGSFMTSARLSPPRVAVAPATTTWDFDPWVMLAVARSTVPVFTSTFTAVCCAALTEFSSTRIRESGLMV